MLADPVQRFPTIPISPRFHLSKNKSAKTHQKLQNLCLYPLTPIPYRGCYWLPWGNTLAATKQAQWAHYWVKRGWTLIGHAGISAGHPAHPGNAMLRNCMGLPIHLVPDLKGSHKSLACLSWVREMDPWSRRKMWTWTCWRPSRP